MLTDESRAAEMFNEDNSEASAQGVLAHLCAHPAQAKEDGLPMKREELYDRACPRS